MISDYKPIDLARLIENELTKTNDFYRKHLIPKMPTAFEAQAYWAALTEKDTIIQHIKSRSEEDYHEE